MHLVLVVISWNWKFRDCLKEKVASENTGDGKLLQSYPPVKIGA
jgi:hypothetical protein